MPVIDNQYERSGAPPCGTKNIGQQDFSRPWLTYGIALTFLLVFVIETFASLRLEAQPFQFNTPLLLILGALNRGLVLARHEGFRLITATLLHGGFIHIALNCFALFMVGPLLERLIGRAWLFTLYTASGLGGSLMSLWINDSGTVSVGASGAIMGLFAALYVLSFKLPKGEVRKRLQKDLIIILVSSLLPLFSAGLFHIDYGAHLGGAITGSIFGLFLLFSWPAGKALPGNRPLANILALSSLALTLTALMQFWGVLFS